MKNGQSNSAELQKTDNDSLSVVEAEVRLRCLNCGRPLKEYLLEDIEDETLKLPFCDDQCMDAYKDVDPNYFG